MSKHLPECWAKDESDPPAWCICDELRACKRRVAESMNRAWEKFSRDQFDAGYAVGLDAAREAVEAIPAPYKVKGQYETYGPYNEGRADFKDAALSAIDALRENQ